MCGPVPIDEDTRQRIAAFTAEAGEPTSSPFGPDDEVGMINLITPQIAQEHLARADGGRLFDPSVDLFLGRPYRRAR